MKTERRAPVKVNLFLHMAGRREDGYHLLYSCMQTISVFDEISVEIDPVKDGEKGEVILVSDSGRLPADPEKNTAVAAARRFLRKAGEENRRVTIRLVKNIPSEAGLGGGSSDAATVLLALDELLPGKVSRQELAEIALSIGADVPFFLCGGTVLCEGVGEILSPMPALSGIPMLLLKPPAGVSTPYCYKEWDKTGSECISEQEKAQLKKDLQDMEDPASHLQELCRSWSNDLEGPAVASVSEIRDGIDSLIENGARFAAMSGSGSAVFGLFEDEETRDQARNSQSIQSLIEKGWWVQTAETI